MSVIKELARVIRVVSAFTAVVVLGLVVVLQSTVPEWCDASQRDVAVECATSNGASR